jgi:hypothetical protein
MTATLIRGEMGPNAGPNACIAVAAGDQDTISAYDFPSIDEQHFAEQLTRMDMVILLKINIYFFSEI